MGAYSLAEKHLGVGEVDREITDTILLRSEALSNEETGERCEFPVELTVHSNGNGDKVTERMATALRQAAFDAMDEVDRQIEMLEAEEDAEEWD